MLLIAEVNQTVEVHRQIVVIDLDHAFEQVLLHVAIQNHLIDMVSKKLGILHCSVKIELGVAFLRECSREIGVQVEVANIF